MHFIGEKMHSTRRYLFYVLLVCALYGLGAMAGTIRQSDKNSHASLTKNNLKSSSLEYQRQKRQTENEPEEESFEMTDFINVMTPGDAKRDIVFVVDRSWGMGKRDFYLQEKKLMRSIINQYITLHPNYAHVAIITFAKDIEVPVDTITPNSTPMTKTELFNSYEKPWEQVLHKIDPEISKGTYVHLALKKAREILTAGEQLDRNATKIVILISDGDYQPQNDSVTVEEADSLKKMGVFVFTCGLGSWLSIANVRQIATQETFYGHILDWKEGISTSGLMTTGRADDYPIWTTLPADRQVEFCGQECVNGQCDTDATTGITECRCSVGYYLVDRVCTECPPHTYKDTVGNEECKRCPSQLGYGTYQRASTSASQCVCLNGPGNCAPFTCPVCNEPNTECVHVGGGPGECVCKRGFVDNGLGQCVNEDNCVNNNCQNSAACLDGLDLYVCVCEWGFEGRYCERRINECSHQYYDQPLCLNNGTCSYLQFRNDFICECSDEYQGYFCQDPVEPPTPTPAPNPLPGQNPTVEPASGDDNDLLIIIIAASLAGVLLIVFIIIICCCICHVRRKKKREEEEKRNAELDAQLRKGGRYTKKSRQLPKTISQKFSGFWKKKTVRGGWADGEIVEGAPSAPPKKRPDLLSSADNPEGNLHVVDEVVIGNTIIDDPGSLKGWKSYLNDLEQAGMIKSGIVANIDSGKAATTLEYVENNVENDKIFETITTKQVNIPMHIQRWEFQAIENDGSVMSGASIGDLQEQLNVVAARTRKYLVVLISSADNPVEKIKKEAQYITDHISSEGY